MLEKLFDVIEVAVRRAEDRFGRAGTARLEPRIDVHVSAQAGQKPSIAAVTCPACAANIQIPAEGGTCFCSYCGTQLAVDDGTVTVVYRAIDETRVREMEIEKALELKRLEIEEKRFPIRLKLSLFFVAIGVLMIIVGWFAGNASGDKNSPWYMVSMVGMCLPMGALLIWPGDDRGKK